MTKKTKKSKSTSRGITNGSQIEITMVTARQLSVDEADSPPPQYKRQRRLSPMLVSARDPYYSQTLEIDDDCEEEDDVSSFPPSRVGGSFVYQRRRTRHEWNKKGSIVEEIVTEREQVALLSLQKYGRVFGRWQNDARRTYFLPSYVKSKLDSDRSGRVGQMEKWAREKFKSWTMKKHKWQALYKNLDLWHSSFKQIEGYFGAGVAAYFVFLKWLFVMNLGICVTTFFFVILPQTILNPKEEYSFSLFGNISDERKELSQFCTSKYHVRVNTIDVPLMVLDLLQGTGWMEQTVMFYGSYSHKMLELGEDNPRGTYNMPGSYLFVIMVCIFISLLMMVRHTAMGIKGRIIEAEDKYFLYGSLTFASWDCTMNDPRSAVLKHRSIYNEMRAELFEQRRLIALRLLTTRDKVKLITRRIFINIFVISMLGGSGALIYWATNESTQYVRSTSYRTQIQLVRLLVQYTPSLTITSLNFLIPFIFRKVVKGEEFSKTMEIQITLGRTVFLRLASLGVLVFTIYTQITCPKKNECDVGTDDCPEISCWETYVGQQIYKLVILDFFTVLLTVSMVQFPQTFIVKNFNTAFTRTLGKPEFQIPKNVLDLVYSQSLCWLGLVFSPVIPFICVIKCFCFFYLKKYTCIYNHEPASKPYRASKSHAFFMFVLLTSFVLICIPIAYIIWKMTPSKGCGPYRVYESIFDVVLYAVNAAHPGVKQIIKFCLSPGFVAPLIAFLCCMTYYFAEISKANNIRTTQLKEQLIMEGKDKQYLLSKIDRLTTKGREPPPRRRKTSHFYVSGSLR